MHDIFYEEKINMPSNGVRGINRVIVITGLMLMVSHPADAFFQGGQVGKSSFGIDLSDIAPPPGEMGGIIGRYMADFGSLDRSYSGTASPARQARLKKFTNDWLNSLERLDFDAMNQADEIDYLLFKNYLTHESRQLEIESKLIAESVSLMPFAQTIADLEDARRRMEWVDASKMADLLNNMDKQIVAARNAIESRPGSDEKSKKQQTAAPIKKAVANRAAESLKVLRNTLKHWFNFYNGYDPMFTWWVGQPYKAVDQSLKDYAEFIKEKLVGVKADDDTTIIGNPIGREAIMSDLAYQMIPYTPEELIAIANNEFTWCETEMKRASRELGCGDNWHKALEYVKTRHVDPGKQPELVKSLALEAIDFIDQHDLVTVPDLARESWHMEMLSPDQQRVSPFFLGGDDILVAFPTNTMDHEEKLMTMRGNNMHFARATVFHELIPGHHLQGFMNERYRTYRGVFGTPFWTEGWAFYWEMLFWEIDFPKSPEDRIGMLFWRMHRCARIIFSLGFHLEKMSPQECINFLIERVGHEPANAAAEVRRSFNGSYGPLYQCAYMLGALQFRSLHHDLVESGKMTNRAFHDAILKENNIPIELVRAILTKQHLSRNFVSSWKFYGEHPAAK